MKKTLKLWQMIALTVLLLGVIISLFVPVYQINGQRLVKISVELISMTQSEEDDSKDSIISAGLDKESTREEVADYLDEQLEKDEGDLLLTCSGFDLIRGKMIQGESKKQIEKYMEKDVDDRSDEEASLIAMYNIYKTARILLIIVYLLPLLLILVCVLSFILKWSKFRIAVLGSIYALLDIVIFGGLYFFLPNMMGYKISGIFDKLKSFDFLGGSSVDSLVDEAVLKVSRCIWEGFRSPGFLVTALLGIGILAVSILIMLMNSSNVIQEFPAPQPVPNPVPIPPYLNSDPMPIPTPPQPAPTPAPVPVPKPAPAPDPIPVPQKMMGKVICTEGAAKGQGCRLPEENKLLIGANPGQCSMVITGQYVSGLHCSVRYNAQRNTYIVKDHSSNGTYVNGLKLPKETEMEYPAGTTLVLADGSNKITLG